MHAQSSVRWEDPNPNDIPWPIFKNTSNPQLKCWFLLVARSYCKEWIGIFCESFWAVGDPCVLCLTSLDDVFMFIPIVPGMKHPRRGLHCEVGWHITLETSNSGIVRGFAHWGLLWRPFLKLNMHSTFQQKHSVLNADTKWWYNCCFFTVVFF